jgi:hypothetical protein
MGLNKFFKRTEVEETPKDIYNWRIYFAAIVASFAAVIIGYDAGFIGGTITLPGFEDAFEYNLTS